MLDAEFEAFQASRPLDAGFPDPQLFSNDPHVQAFDTNSNQPQLPNWASDFQTLRLNDARISPISQSKFHQHAPLQRSPTSTLHLGNQSSAYQPQQQRRYASGWEQGYTGGLGYQTQRPLSSIAQQKQPEMQVEHAFDEAAFENAFEAARFEVQQAELQEIEQSFKVPRAETQQASQQDIISNQEVYGGLSAEREVWMNHDRIGADRISDEAEEDRTKENHNEADELARTAGQLLENVKNDQSQKFRESNFLSLMRQLRDKEVRVEGDKLVDVSRPSSNPA